ncbi:MAG: hypothetical protein HY069_00235, partial [Chlamydiia bacterium]|nr:hypothetical protein [Chlamydiia bacterium]
KTVYFVHIGGVDSSKYFYDATFYRDEVAKPWVMLREALEKAGYQIGFTYDCTQLKDVAAIVSINDGSPELLQHLRRYAHKSLLLVMEPPIVLSQLHDRKLKYYFAKILTLFDAPIDQVKYFKLHFPQPRLEMLPERVEFSNKKFAAMINANKDFEGAGSLYAERKNVIACFSEVPEGFDLYGPGWEGLSAWRGTVVSKWVTLKDYKFCFCYENLTDQTGYITEKIFDAFVAGCVPIYLGADNVTDYIPKNCFIDRRDFPSLAELYHFLQQMDAAAYDLYVARIQEFLHSEKAQVFSSEHFVQTLLKAIQEIDKCFF